MNERLGMISGRRHPVGGVSVLFFNPVPWIRAEPISGMSGTNIRPQ